MFSNNWSPEDVRVRRIHETYISIIAVVIIIILASVKWHKIDTLTSLLNFSLTLLSAILAILAIGYAVYTNSASGNTTHVLTNASRDVERTASAITSATAIMTESAGRLQRDIEQLSGVTLGIHKTLEEQRADLASISSRLNVDLSSQQLAPLAGATDQGIVRPVTDDQKRQILRRSSVSGLYALLCYARSADTETVIDFSMVLDVNGLTSNKTYIHGFLVAMSVSGIAPARLSGTTVRSIPPATFTYDEVKQALLVARERHTTIIDVLPTIEQRLNVRPPPGEGAV